MGNVIDRTNLPAHVAIIMDGNGRWAKKKGAARIFGHQNAIKAVREATEFCAEEGISYLTLYAFSTENWARPKDEVEGLMSLLVSTIKKELPTLIENNVRLSTIGAVESLPTKTRLKLDEAIKITSVNNGLNLILALNYSGRWEITEAAKELLTKCLEDGLSPNDIDSQLLGEHMNTRGIPDPELLIRTSGEMRISNFMLWQLAYTELYITDVLWPDFRKSHMHKAVTAYQQRERRFGKISEQVNS